MLTKISDQLNGAAIIADVRAHPTAAPLALFPVRFDVERLLVSVQDFGEPGDNPSLDHARGGSTVGTFFDRREIMDDVAFERSAVSRAVLFPQGLYEATACALDRRPDRLSVMALARGRNKGAFSSDEVGYLHSLSGHLRRALELTARAQEWQIANHYLDQIIESLPHGAIAVDEHWRVLGANESARALLSQGAVFDYQTNRISLPDPPSSRSCSPRWPARRPLPASRRAIPAIASSMAAIRRTPAIRSRCCAATGRRRRMPPAGRFSC
ncbi:PAS domain-containing protein [Breoghania sp. L-A4]|uniref:PAS domain-containing protein n=1 Tax=Breoghania sp. L-A4 TaxID=2304600 RepID=UPI000E35EDEB|nr:PAS domain-containing protein [Breoghania sp. L-A4]AXS39592.1 hypothetical protein D1F64_05405 [Breoghania sp. L-A4]